RPTRDPAGETVKRETANERDGQPDEPSQNARPDGIGAEGGGDASFLFDAHRSLQRVLEHAGEISRFRFAHPSAADLSAPAEILRVDRGRRLDDAVEENGETLLEMGGREFIEALRSLGIQLEADLPFIL